MFLGVQRSPQVRPLRKPQAPSLKISKYQCKQSVLFRVTLFFFSRVPEIELKNAKGLSNESVNLLKSRLEEVAKKHCGEV